MILDISDPIWVEYFTEDELEEIESEKISPISELPDDIKMYLNNYKNLVGFFAACFFFHF